MKNIKFNLLLFLSFLFNQDIAGQYRLTGLSAVDYDFARYDTDIIITESSGIGLELIGDSFKQGEIIEYAYQVPANELLLQVTGVVLNVTFTQDGIAMVTEGSSYPTAVMENCVTTVGTLPITGEQGYSSDLTNITTIPTHDIIGLSSLSPYKNLTAGRISITQSNVFDMIPLTPQSVNIPFPIDTSSVTGNEGMMISANSMLPGMTAGYVIKSTEMLSMHNIAGYLTRPSLYFEWHAIDGEVNESGLGDDINLDEDGDGTLFDNIFGLSSIYVTKVKPLSECNNNYDYPIAGRKTEELRQINFYICIDNNLSDDCNEYADEWVTNCIDETINSSNSGQLIYALDPYNTNNTLWKGIATFNSLKYHQTNNPIYLSDDSNHDFDSSCLENGTDDECSGRYTFKFNPQCIQSFNVRYFMSEMTEECEDNEKDECGVCFGEGQVTWYVDNDYDGLGDPSSTPVVGCLPTCTDLDGDSYCDERYASNSDDTCVPGVVDECGICNGNGPSNGLDCDGNPLSIIEMDIPQSLSISSFYPNPFNPSINIEINSNSSKNINLDILNIKGERIVELYSGNITTSARNFIWEADVSLASGVYLIRLRSSDEVLTKKILLLK